MSYKIPKEILKLFHINNVVEGEITYVNPHKLVCKERFDIILKYIYIDLRERCCEYAKNLYVEHIGSMTRGSFVEPFSQKKNAEMFVDEFEKLIDSIKKEGYNKTLPPIFVDEEYRILDGAHRVAICLYYEISVPVVVLPVRGQYNLYNQQFFEKSLLNQDYIDLAMQYFLRLTKDTVLCMNVWPSAIGHEEELNSIINENFQLVYRKDIILNENGAFYYLAQIYKEYSWVQEGDGDLSGVYRKLVPCFPNFSPVRTYFVIPKENVDLVNVKSKMRSLYNLDKHSLHMTDNLDETIQMGEIVLSNCTLEFLNKCNALKYKSTLKLLEQGTSLKKRYGKDMCICGSIVLALYGIREAQDLDYLCSCKDAESHNEYIDLYELSLSEAIYRPDIHINFYGFSFLCLEQERIFKKNRQEGKDIDDVKLIALFEEGRGLSKKMKYLQSKRRIIAKIQGKIIRIAHATGTFSLLRSIYRFLKRKKN